MKKLDFHVHIYADCSVEEVAENFKAMMARHNLCGVGLMALHHNSKGFHPTCNEDALKLRSLLPEAYAFASIHMDQDYVEQAKRYMDQGFDGIKLLNGKPSEYRFFGSGYETPEFDRLFAYCEKEQIPMVIHNNDPRLYWQQSPKTEHLREKGWFYGDGDLPTQEQFFVMLEDVFRRHPHLRAAVAHMGFYYDNIPRAVALLESCPNLYFDMTPAVEVYVELSQQREKAEQFVRAYHDRLIFGTDAVASLKEGNRPWEFNCTKHEMMETFYGGDAPRDVGKYHVEPVKVEPYMLENIYYNNAMRFMKKPLPQDK